MNDLFQKFQEVQQEKRLRIVEPPKTNEEKAKEVAKQIRAIDKRARRLWNLKDKMVKEIIESANLKYGDGQRIVVNIGEEEMIIEENKINISPIKLYRCKFVEKK